MVYDAGPLHRLQPRHAGRSAAAAGGVQGRPGHHTANSQGKWWASWLVSWLSQVVGQLALLSVLSLMHALLARLALTNVEHCRRT